MSTIPQAEVDGLLAVEEVRFSGDQTVQTTAYQPPVAPNEIPGLILWLAAGDRASGPYEISNPNAIVPVTFRGWPLINRVTGTLSAVGTARPGSGWSGTVADIGEHPTGRTYLDAPVGTDRFVEGWTFLMLWKPYRTDLNRNAYQIHMAYRSNPTDDPDGPGFSPAIGSGNFDGTGTGFLAYADDGIGKVTPQFNIDWGHWYIVGADGRSGARFKCRVNGVNSPPVPLGTLNTVDNQDIVWGGAETIRPAAQGQLLEACVWTRALADEEYAVVEAFWRRKYDNILLGQATLSAATAQVDPKIFAKGEHHKLFGRKK